MTDAYSSLPANFTECFMYHRAALNSILTRSYTTSYCSLQQSAHNWQNTYKYKTMFTTQDDQFTIITTVKLPDMSTKSSPIMKYANYSKTMQSYHIKILNTNYPITYSSAILFYYPQNWQNYALLNMIAPVLTLWKVASSNNHKNVSVTRTAIINTFSVRDIVPNVLCWPSCTPSTFLKLCTTFLIRPCSKVSVFTSGSASISTQLAASSDEQHWTNQLWSEQIRPHQLWAASVPQWIQYKLCLLVYKALCGLALQTLADFCFSCQWQKRTAIVHAPWPHRCLDYSKLWRRSFAVSTPLAWNHFLIRLSIGPPL